VVVNRDSGVVVNGVPLFIQNIQTVFCEHLSIWFQVSRENWKLEINEFVHIVTSILVNDSFFLLKLFCFIQIFQFVHLLFPY